MINNTQHDYYYLTSIKKKDRVFWAYDFKYRPSSSKEGKYQFPEVKTTVKRASITRIISSGNDMLKLSKDEMFTDNRSKWDNKFGYSGRELRIHLQRRLRENENFCSYFSINNTSVPGNFSLDLYLIDRDVIRICGESYDKDSHILNNYNDNYKYFNHVALVHFKNYKIDTFSLR